MNWNTRSTLLHKLNSGSPQGWEEFSQVYSPFIHSSLLKMNIPQELREDILQEVLMKIHCAYQKGTSYQKGDRVQTRFRSWLSTVVKNTALNVLKQQKKHKRNIPIDALTDDEIHDIAAPDPLLEIIEQEWAKHMCQLAIEKAEKHFKDKICKEIFLLAMDNVPFKEISKRFEISLSACTMKYHRFKKAFGLELVKLQNTFEPLISS